MNDDDEPTAATTDAAASPSSPEQDVATLQRRQSATKIFADAGGVKLTWKHLSYRVLMPDGSLKTILDDLSGVARPGRVLAITGPSGAGKSTFLRSIGARLVLDAGSGLDGTVFLNDDLLLSEKHRPIISFVVQDDVAVMPKEHVDDAFRFSARIRHPAMATEDVEERVEAMIDDLHLRDCRDTIMGIPGLLAGVSGGEKRRTNIGVELIANPPVICLDEPTSGLDSVAAYRIGELLHGLAHIEKRTVVCTIHSPSSALFGLFDDLLMLAGSGRVAYHGPASAVREYFASIDRPMPDRVNPSEFAMRCLQLGGDELEFFFDAWRRTAADAVAAVAASASVSASEPFGDESNNNVASASEPIAGVVSSNAFLQKHGDTVRASLAPPSVVVDPRQVSESNAVVDALLAAREPPTLAQQFALVSARSWRNLTRDKFLTVARVVQSTAFSVLLGLFFVNLDLSPSGIRDRQTALFALCVHGCMLAMLPAVLSFASEFAVFLQDQSNGLYAPGVYYCAKWVVELPINLITPTIYVIVMYFMTNLHRSVENFFVAYAILGILLPQVGVALGMFLSAAAGGKSLESMLVVGMLIFWPLAFTSGLFANSDRLDPGWKWLEAVSMFRYSYVALIRNEFLEMGKLCEPTDKKCRFPDGASVVRFLGFNRYRTDELWFSVTMLVVLMLALHIAGILTMAWRASGQHAELVYARNLHDEQLKMRCEDDRDRKNDGQEE